MTDLSQRTRVPFFKTTGSGNDFVIIDARAADVEPLKSPEVIRSICDRHNGIGADGVVFLTPVAGAERVRVDFFNSDGTVAEMCGNATLCSTTVAAQAGLAVPQAMELLTVSGLIRSRVGGDGASIDLAPVTEVRGAVAGVALPEEEGPVGFAGVGVPHLVIRCRDVSTVDVEGRGPALRRHPSLGPAGANVNWVSRAADGRWHYRTFERGVEGETLACGTGAVACAILLTIWGEATADRPVELVTRSGKPVQVRLETSGAGTGEWLPTLAGEGRIVFQGTWYGAS